MLTVNMLGVVTIANVGVDPLRVRVVRQRRGCPVSRGRRGASSPCLRDSGMHASARVAGLEARIFMPSIATLHRTLGHR